MGPDAVTRFTGFARQYDAARPRPPAIEPSADMRAVAVYRVAQASAAPAAHLVVDVPDPARR